MLKREQSICFCKLVNHTFLPLLNIIYLSLSWSWWLCSETLLSFCENWCYELILNWMHDCDGVCVSFHKFEQVCMLEKERTCKFGIRTVKQ